MEIKQSKTKTLKLEKLNFLAFNRPIGVAHAEKMYRSLLKNGILRDPVIVYTDIFDGILKPFVADAQHMVTGCVRLGIRELPCKIVYLDSKEAIVQLIADLNNTSKSWTLDEYATTFASIGKDDYTYILKKKKKYGTTLRSIAAAYSSALNVGETIKKGTYKADRRKQGDKIMKIYQDVGKQIGFLAHQLTAFTIFYRTLGHVPYSHNTMIQGLVRNKTKIKGMSINNTIEILNTIYFEQLEVEELASVV